MSESRLIYVNYLRIIIFEIKKKIFCFDKIDILLVSYNNQEKTSLMQDSIIDMADDA